MNKKYCMIETAFDNKEKLEEIVSELLKNKLVSGCQMIESNSRWSWKKEIESSKEYVLFMKTKRSLVKDIYKTVKCLHSYECFEFAIFDLTSCNQEYLNWIKEETK